MKVRLPFVHFLFLSFLLVTACGPSSSDSQEPVSDIENETIVDSELSEVELSEVELSEADPTNDADTPNVSNSNFQKFSYEPGGFEIDTPVTLEHSVMEPIPTSFGNVERNEFMGGEGQTIEYLVAYTDFPSELMRTYTVLETLDEERDTLIESFGGTLRSEEPISINGYPGRAFVIEVNDSGIAYRIDTHIFVVDNRIYQLMALAAPNWEEQPEASTQFLESFRLL